MGRLKEVLRVQAPELLEETNALHRKISARLGVTDVPLVGSESQKPSGLVQIRFELEIPTVSKEVYEETRRAVEAAIPGVFFASIRPVSIEDLLREDEKRILEGESRRFNPDWVNPSETMRAAVPPAMEVFIDPKAIRIERSNRLSTDEQKGEIAKVAARYRKRLPQGLREYVNWHMGGPSTMAQLEDAWMDAGRGLLLPNFFARTDIQTVGGDVAGVGRHDPAYQRNVHGWRRDGGLVSVFAVAVGVLPQKLAA